MIAEKTHGLNEDGTVAFLLEAENCVFNSRAKPRASRHALTLECESPVSGRERGCFCDQGSGFLSLSLIGIAVCNGALGDAVSRENSRDVLRSARGELLGESFDQQWMIVPGLNEIKGERWVLFGESGAVE